MKTEEYNNGNLKKYTTGTQADQMMQKNKSASWQTRYLKSFY